MKKVMEKLAMLALCVAMSVSFAACSDDNDDDNNGGGGQTPVNPTVPEFTTNLVAEGQYRGDWYDTGNGNILLGISDKSIVYDVSKEEYVGSGKTIVIDINTILPEDPDFATIVQGKYTGNNTHDKGTFTLGGNSYVLTYNDGKVTKSLATKGTINITAYGDGVYAVEGSLVTNSGATKVSYVGNIPIYNRSFSGAASNLKNSVNLTGFTQGVMIDNGTFYSETSDYIMVGIAEQDFSLIANYGNGRCVWLGFNVTVGAEGVPSGTYTLLNSTEMGEDEDFMPFTVLDGFYFPPLDAFFGSWYFYAGGGIEAAIKSGTVTVNNKGNDRYSISFNVKDGHGNDIKGSYDGEFVYIKDHATL